MRVVNVRQEGLQMRHVTLASEKPVVFTYGQYVQIEADGEKPGYFAIASAPEQTNCLEFLVKEAVGTAGALYGAKPGGSFRVGDPQGPGFPREHLLGKNVILIGVGSGIAPLRSVIGSILAARHEYGERVMLLYGARSPFHIPYRAEIAKWRAHIEVYKAMSQPEDADWSGYVGYVQHILEDIEIPSDNTLACVCGMSPMVSAVKARLEEMGIPEDDVYLNF
ncbi:MAG: NAD-binding oxidoreductase [Leptospirillia bacterium]